MSNARSRQSESSTSSSLIRRVQLRDGEAWRRLTELYGPLVYHWCRRMGIGSDDAADLLQDVLVTVIRSIGRFDPRREKGTFRGWLWTITRNKVRDHLRRRPDWAQAPGGTDAQIRLAQLPDPLTDESDDAGDRTATASLFHRALRMIEPQFERRTWQAFWRATIQQQETARIAADLAMSPAAVRQAKSRVLRRLRQVLGDLPSG